MTLIHHTIFKYPHIFLSWKGFPFQTHPDLFLRTCEETLGRKRYEPWVLFKSIPCKPRSMDAPSVCGHGGSGARGGASTAIACVAVGKIRVGVRGVYSYVVIAAAVLNCLSKWWSHLYVLTQRAAPWLRKFARLKPIGGDEGAAWLAVTAMVTHFDPDPCDYYAHLETSVDATDAEIKKKRRQLTMQHHPDKWGGDDTKMKLINEAAGVLCCPQKRAFYDAFGEVGSTLADGCKSFKDARPITIMLTRESTSKRWGLLLDDHNKVKKIRDACNAAPKLKVGDLVTMVSADARFPRRRLIDHGKVKASVRRFHTKTQLYIKIIGNRLSP